jgi:hypothetical protein
VGSTGLRVPRIGRPLDPGHRGDAFGTAVELVALASHACALANNRDGECAQAGHRDGGRAHFTDRHGPEAQAGEQRADGEAAVDPAQQPSVAESDHAATGGEPAEEHSARRPLQQHRRGVEANHGRAG